MLLSVKQWQGILCFSELAIPWTTDQTLSDIDKKIMGLEGSELIEKMEVFDSLRLNIPKGPNPVSSCGLEICAAGELVMNDDPNCQMTLLLQVMQHYD